MHRYDANTGMQRIKRVSPLLHQFGTIQNDSATGDRKRVASVRGGWIGMNNDAGGGGGGGGVRSCVHRQLAVFNTFVDARKRVW